jgi:thioredoxin-related protein
MNIYLITLLLFSSFSFAQGIIFQKIPLKTHWQKTTASTKPLFVEVYLKGCPHCESLAPILREKEVGDFFNKHFVSYQIEANAKESADLQKQFGITYPEFPIFLFFEKNTLVHIATPAEHTDKAAFIKEVLQHGRTALNPTQRTATYPQRFQEGERDLMFLINYAKTTKVFKDTKTLHLLNQHLANAITQPQDRLGQVGFYVLKRFMDDFQNPLSVFFFQNIVRYQQQYGAKEPKEAGETIIFHTLYGPRGDSLSVTEIQQMREAMVKLGVEANEAASRTLLKELEAYFRAANTIGAVHYFNQYRRNSVIDANTYAYLLRFFNEKATDLSYLPEMQQWANDGLQRLQPTEKNTQVEADFYYEWAECLRRMNKKEVAKSLAQKSLDLATLAKVDLKKYQNLLNQMLP